MSVESTLSFTDQNHQKQASKENNNSRFKNMGHFIFSKLSTSTDKQPASSVSKTVPSQTSSNTTTTTGSSFTTSSAEKRSSSSRLLNIFDSLTNFSAKKRSSKTGKFSANFVSKKFSKSHAKNAPAKNNDFDSLTVDELLSKEDTVKVNLVDNSMVKSKIQAASRRTPRRSSNTSSVASVQTTPSVVATSTHPETESDKLNMIRESVNHRGTEFQSKSFELKSSPKKINPDLKSSNQSTPVKTVLRPISQSPEDDRRSRPTSPPVIYSTENSRESDTVNGHSSPFSISSASPNKTTQSPAISISTSSFNTPSSNSSPPNELTPFHCSSKKSYHSSSRHDTTNTSRDSSTEGSLVFSFRHTHDTFEPNFKTAKPSNNPIIYDNNFAVTNSPDSYEPQNIPNSLSTSLDQIDFYAPTAVPTGKVVYQRTISSNDKILNTRVINIKKQPPNNKPNELNNKVAPIETSRASDEPCWKELALRKQNAWTQKQFAHEIERHSENFSQERFQEIIGETGFNSTTSRVKSMIKDLDSSTNSASLIKRQYF